MVHVALAVLLTLGSAGEVKKGGGSRGAGRRGRTIVLTDRNASTPQEIRVGAGVFTSVEFPEEIKERPQCKDCTDVSHPGEGRFVLAAGELSRYLTIGVNASARRWAGVSGGGVTLLPVKLEHGVVMLALRRVDPQKAEKLVTFVAPDRTAENEYLRVERRKLEAAVADQIRSGVDEEFRKAFLREHRCEQSRARVRHDDIVLEVNEVCVFGDRVVLVFTVENRARPAFEAGSLVVNKVEGKPYELGAPLESGESRTGVVVGTVKEGVQPHGRYEIVLHEGGGKGRVLTLKGIEI